MVDIAVQRGVFNETQSADNDFLGSVINYIYQGEYANNGNTPVGEKTSSEAVAKAKEIMNYHGIKYSLLLNEQ